jgi:hypothetical protein
MAGIAKLGDLSRGHDGFPPSPMVTTPIKKTYYNGKLIGALSPLCQYEAHSSGSTTHQQTERYPITGSSKTYVEGFAIIRKGDQLNDGDYVEVEESATNSYIE